MRIDGYEALRVAEYFDLPTVYHEELKEIRSGDEDVKTLQMPVVLEVLSRRKKQPARLFREEENLRRWLREFNQVRERDERAVVKEQPTPLGRLRVSIGIRYDTGQSYISLSPYPDCTQLLSRGIVPVTMDFARQTDVSQYKLYELVQSSGIQGHILGQIGRILLRMLQMFYQGDFLRIQAVPLVITLEEEVLIGGLTLEMDDLAMTRQEKILERVQRSQSNRLVDDASQAGLVYRIIDPEGTVGVMASGMGLALNSLDLLVRQGMSVAGCLVLGGGVSEERMAAGVRVLAQIPHVKGLLIHVYGGVNSCEIMAKGIVNALEEEDRELKVVVKMGGHDQEEGWRVLDEAGLVSVRSPSGEEAVEQLSRLIHQKKEKHI